MLAAYELPFVGVLIIGIHLVQVNSGLIRRTVWRNTFME